MTVCIPLEVADETDASALPSFIDCIQSRTTIDEVVNAITKARRIVVVTGALLSLHTHSTHFYRQIVGAGISVKAGIPDFRSPSGLFNSLKKDNPKEGLTSGKDLFDASVFGVRLFHLR